MNKPKILIDLERLRYPKSGIANVFRNLALSLQRIFHNFDIQYFGNRDELKKIYSPINVVNRKSWHKVFECFSNQYDIVHVSHQLSSYFHKNYKNTKKIVTLHDLNFLHENLSDYKRQKTLRKVNQNLKTADYIVCISEFVKEDLQKNKHLLRLDKLKEIFVIHNGIEIPENRNYDIGKYTFLKNKKYILNIGVLQDKKNQKVLIEMLPFIEEDLVLVFSEEKEPYVSTLRDRIKELEIQHRVHFLKNIIEEEKYALIQNCVAMCHPSLAEGFGIPPIEAMAFGKPVFLSRLTSLPEIGGDFAFYFEDFCPENMAKIYLEKIKWYDLNKENVSIGIRKWAQQFNKERMGQEYLALYDKILK